MRLRCVSMCVLVLLCGSLSLAAPAEKKAKPQRPAKTIRVLLFTGGHAFEEEAFFGTFDKMRGVEYTKALLPENADLLKPGLETQYDVIVRYDMCKTDLTPQQQQQFVALLEKGIGLVSLHHNLGAQRGWKQYADIIGGRYIFGDQEIDGVKYTTTPWKHDETLEVKVADPEHPITKGLKDFTIHDETYGTFYVAADTHVLLTTKHPENNREIAWTTQFGNSRVYYLMLGHDSKAYANPAFKQLLARGIRWAAAEPTAPKAQKSAR